MGLVVFKTINKSITITILAKNTIIHKAAAVHIPTNVLVLHNFFSYF